MVEEEWPDGIRDWGWQGCLEDTTPSTTLEVCAATEQKDILNKKYSCSGSNRSHSAIIIRTPQYCMSMHANFLETTFQSKNPDRYFVLCETCFWCSSLLREVRIECPACNTSNRISLIPLTINESYNIRNDPRCGLEVSFSISKI